jgi:rubrerythrin
MPEAAGVLESVRARLLEAWRGEIVAGAVYELIARRMPEREAEILRRMAEAEGAHRRRLEMTLAGVIVGGATYLVGLALPT